jgi:hypothetical protein
VVLRCALGSALGVSVGLAACERRSPPDEEQGAAGVGASTAEAGAPGGAEPGGTGGADGSVVPPGNRYPCEDPQALVGGFVRCASGLLHRAEAGNCPTSVPRAEPVIDNAGGAPGECYDADCAHLGPHGFCSEYPYCEDSISSSGVGCYAGCMTDADCEAGQLCLCGSLFERRGPEIPVGLCVEATCRTDADCRDGFLCTSYVAYGEVLFACQTPDDECDDCPGNCRPRSDRPGGPVYRSCAGSEQCGGP